MSRFKFDPNAIPKLRKLALTKSRVEVDRVVTDFRCPDHLKARFHTEGSNDESYQIVGCCDKGVRLAAEAAGFEIRDG